MLGLQVRVPMSLPMLKTSVNCKVPTSDHGKKFYFIGGPLRANIFCVTADYYYHAVILTLFDLPSLCTLSLFDFNVVLSFQRAHWNFETHIWHGHLAVSEVGPKSSIANYRPQNVSCLFSSISLFYCVHSYHPPYQQCNVSILTEGAGDPGFASARKGGGVGRIFYAMRCSEELVDVHACRMYVVHFVSSAYVL